MKISVVIPVYNAKSYLKRCVNSVLQQTYKDLEIILVDDGSSDGSGELCNQIALTDKRIQVIHQKNMGSAKARNTGIQAAKGNYIVFLDSDDEWLINDGIEKILKDSSKNCDMIVFNMSDIWMGGRNIIPMKNYDLENITKLSTPQAIFTYLIKTQRFFVTSTNLIILRSLLIDNNIFFNENLVVAEDLDWSLRVWQVIKSTSFHNIYLYGYHHRSGSLSQTISIRCYRSTDMIFSHWEKLCKNNCVNNDSIRAFLANRWVSSGYGHHKLPNSEKKEALFILQKHKYLLDYAYTPKVHRVAFLVRLFGVKYCCLILGIYWRLRTRVKQQGI